MSVNLADVHRSGCYRLEGETTWHIAKGCHWAHPELNAEEQEVALSAAWLKLHPGDEPHKARPPMSMVWRKN